MITIQDIMTSPVTTLSPSATLADAHDLTRTTGIRHLPIVDKTNNELIGIVTQKKMISNVVSLVAEHGSERLTEKEKEVNIQDVAVCDFETVLPTQTVRDVAPFFLNNKHGCLPVVNENNTLIGIITSSDFVKLTITLLENVKD